MSKAPIWSLRIRRCFIRKRSASRRDLGRRAVWAVKREWVQRWTTWWSRSSNTAD